MAVKTDHRVDPATEYRLDEMWDLEAERACLCGMFDPEVLAEVVEILEPGDFYREGHKIIARDMISMWAQEIPVDPVTLWDYMVQEGDTRAIGDDRMYLHNLYDYGAVRVGAPHHARIIREFAVRQKLARMGIKIQQRSAWRDSSAATMLEEMEAQLQEIRSLAEHQAGSDGVMTMAEFATRTWARAAPVIPGMLDLMDRVILVAKGGEGKTMVGLQVAFCTAAGLHPFALAPIPPKRVLVLDLENPHAILQRRIRKFRETAQSVGTYDDRNIHIFSRPGGLDLRVAKDAQELTGVIRRIQPDLIVGGPIYKMLMDQGEGAEHLHSGITAYWDKIRAMFGPALWLETHPPVGEKAPLRPYGSGIYSRWPEFGLGMARSKTSGVWTFERFKGDREEGRSFPDEISRTNGWGAQWPWIGTYNSGLPNMPLDEEPEVRTG